MRTENTERTFDPAVGETFHEMVKKGGKLLLQNGHIAGPRPNISHTVMPLRGQWLPPKELRERFEDTRWIELD